MTTHKDFDGLEIVATHIGKNVTATAKYAGWDDWYYVMVKGTFDNGNKADGCFCRAQAYEIASYLKGRN